MVLIEIHYLPCIAYFTSFFDQEKILIETNENYIKQSYRNRCLIKTSNKIDSLSIPVIGGSKKTIIRDVKIEYSQSWVNDHWRAIQAAYGRSPYFEFYKEYIRDIYDKRLTYLLDFNLEMLTLCLKFLQMNTIVSFSDSFEKVYSDPTIDLRGVISPKNKQNEYSFFSSQQYPQIFGKDFVANLSILDLLFCEGPNARTIIKKSVITL